MPPEAVAVATPVEFPKQRTSVLLDETLSAAAGWLIVVVRVVWQFRASVTVNVYVPAESEDMFWVVAPLLQL